MLLLLSFALAAGSPDAAAFEAAVRTELQAADPEAAAVFEQAGAARTLGDLSRAGELYGQVTERLPESDHAWRRHCTVLQESGARDQALPRCEQALALAARPENRVALAFTLLDLPSGAAATAADRARARTLLDEARSEAPDDAMGARLRCHLAAEEEDLDLLRACVADLERLAPDHVMTGFHAWSLAYREGRWTDALSALDRAEAAGMPAADADSFRQLTRDARPRWRVWAPALGVGALLGGLTWGVGVRVRRRRA